MAVKIITELTIKPGKGQSQEAAEAEFITLFQQYLTNNEGTFQADYGPEAWGGYDGPTVSAVAFPEQDAQTTAASVSPS